MNNLGPESISGFDQEFGSINCKELLGCDSGSASGYIKARMQDMFKNICPRFADGALEVLDRVMDDHEKHHPTSGQADSHTS